jgi:radical SAM protein with 4Fe4S-binding SPASM domain
MALIAKIIKQAAKRSLLSVPELDFPPIEAIDKFHFDIVHGCQLRCVGCPNSTLAPPIQRVAVADFDACLRNVDVKRVRYLRLFAFGEPLLHRDLGGILECIPRQSWSVEKVEISSNGQNPDWDDLERAFRTQVLTSLAVSCDGDGTPQDYERLRPPSRWERLIEFLERTRELRDRYHPRLALLTRTICDDPAAQARWREVLEPRGWVPEFRDWMYLPDASMNMTGHEIRVPHRVCRFQDVHDRLYVDYDGTVVPCCAHPRAAVLGNLRTQTFNQIIRSRARAELLARLSSDRDAMPVCGRCEA